MILLLSPAKSLNYNSGANYQKSSLPIFSDKIQHLANSFKKLSANELGKLFKVSQKLSELNFKRYQEFSSEFNQENSRQALLAFNGDVYNYIATDDYNNQDFDFAQKHILILSGLYGLLRPLDLMQPYRLEMGTDLTKNPKLKELGLSDLYNYWQEDIAKYLNQQQDEIINLASNEYFLAINPELINNKIINIAFKEEKNGQLKIIGINAKRARGMMANYVVKNKITESQDLKNFSDANYKFNTELSDEDNWIFSR